MSRASLIEWLPLWATQKIFSRSFGRKKKKFSLRLSVSESHIKLHNKWLYCDKERSHLLSFYLISFPLQLLWSCHNIVVDSDSAILINFIWTTKPSMLTQFRLNRLRQIRPPSSPNLAHPTVTCMERKSKMISMSMALLQFQCQYVDAIIVRNKFYGKWKSSLIRMWNKFRFHSIPMFQLAACWKLFTCWYLLEAFFMMKIFFSISDEFRERVKTDDAEFDQQNWFALSRTIKIILAIFNKKKCFNCAVSKLPFLSLSWISAWTNKAFH